MASHARRKRPSLASLVAALLFILNRCGPAFCYFADWSALANEDNEPTCVPIPRNLSLCHGIGYTKVSKVPGRINVCIICTLCCSLFYTLWGVRSVVMLCKAFLTCSIGR